MNQVHPISSYERRVREYRQECRRFYAWAIPGSVLMLAVSLASLYALDRLMGPIKSDWRVVALGIAFATVILPIYVMRPTRPSPGDVTRDQATRRAAGLDDTVSD